MSRRVRFLTTLALLTAPSMAAAQAAQPAPGGAGSSSTQNAEETTDSTTTTTDTAASALGEPSAATAATVAATPTTTTHAAGGSTRISTIPASESFETRATPLVDLHGYIRSRFELFQNYTLGWGAFARTNSYNYNNANLLWYRSPDYSADVCGTQPAPGTGSIIQRGGSCNNPTQTSANMRMRLEPEAHPTEFIGVYSQIDLLDNLVLGSTPEGYYTGATRSPWAPITAINQTQIPPIFNYNGFTNSIVVKRAWAEVTNPTLGQIRFGRMPNQWGLGILANAGNGLDSDYQSTVDRVMYSIRLRNSGLFGALMWDFASSGPSSANITDEVGLTQAYDLSQFDDVHQWVAAVGRRLEPEQARQVMSRGGIVLNGGLYFVYRTQYLSNEQSAQGTGSNVMPCSGNTTGTASQPDYSGTCYQSGAMGPINSTNMQASVFMPDLWLQVLGSDFRVELEAVYIGGTLSNLPGQMNNAGYRISQFGAALEAEYRALNQRLTIGFRSGYASGDSDMDKLSYNGGLPSPTTDSARDLTLFRFHPDYRIDLILWRSLLRQISGAYYFRPSVAYNFIDEPGGDLLFGRVDVIWSRASEFLQTRGHHADLGVEIDATVQYESHHRRPDGTHNTSANHYGMTPGFYANVQGGVLFPLAGLGPTDDERGRQPFSTFSLETAFTVRALLGVRF